MKLKPNHLYQNCLDNRKLYYFSEWSDKTLLVEEFKQVDSPYYPYVYEDEDYTSDLDVFESMLSNGHIIDLGLLSETDFSFQEVYNEVYNYHFGNSTNKVLVRNRMNDLIEELKKLDNVVNVDNFISLAKKYKELIK